MVYLGNGNAVNAGAIRSENTSSAPLTIDKVEADLRRPGVNPGPVFNLWGRFTTPPQSLGILTQTAVGNFSTNDYPVVASCGAPLPAGDNTAPRISITINNATQSFDDTARVLDTGGFNLGRRGNESVGWRRIGSVGIGTLTGRLQPSSPTLSLAGRSAAQLTATFTHRRGERSFGEHDG